MNKKPDTSQSLAEAITKSASKQTYYTIRLLVDRDRSSLMLTGLTAIFAG